MLYGAAWMQSAITSRIAQEAQDTDPFCELEGYLMSPLEPFCSLPDVAVIWWWKDHSIVYPTLTRMARDFLAIPSSSTASERQFSSAQHIGTDFRNRLSPTMFEAMQMLKGGYKAGIISAHLEILCHCYSFTSSLSSNEEIR
jgi:hAT family C-terminal dimerisation region